MADTIQDELKEDKVTFYMKPQRRARVKQDSGFQSRTAKNNLSELNRLWAAMRADSNMTSRFKNILLRLITDIQHETQTQMISELEGLSERACGRLGLFSKTDKPVNLVVLYDDWTEFKTKYGSRKVYARQEDSQNT